MRLVIHGFEHAFKLAHTAVTLAITCVHVHFPPVINNDLP